MTAEEAQALYYQEMTRLDWYDTSGKPLEQSVLQFRVWDAVVKAIRKDYEDENERLRQEVRDYQELIAKMMESDAKPRPVIWGT